MFESEDFPMLLSYLKDKQKVTPEEIDDYIYQHMDECKEYFKGKMYNVGGKPACPTLIDDVSLCRDLEVLHYDINYHTHSVDYHTYSVNNKLVEELLEIFKNKKK